jgi:ABC-2 type transport system permease protein
MPKGLWTLTWIEFKVFMREPMGSVSSLLMPVFIFVVFSQIPAMSGTTENPQSTVIQVPLAVLAIIIIGISNVISLITIISIYREGGILKRLRATPLRPYTILTAHVLVKLVITALSLTLLVLVGKSYGSLSENVNVASFSIAIIFSFVSLMSIGFVIASLVPTARFAQPMASAIIVPMFMFSPVFIPMEIMNDTGLMFILNLSPMTHVVNLLDGIWAGGSWITQIPAIIGLTITFITCTAISTKVFRWE